MNNIIKIDYLFVKKLDNSTPVIYIVYLNSKKIDLLLNIPHNYEKPHFIFENIQAPTKRYTHKRIKKIFDLQNKKLNTLQTTDTKNRKSRITGNKANIKALKKYKQYSHGIDYLTFQFGIKHYLEVENYLFSNIDLNTTNRNYGITYLSTGEAFTVDKTKTANGDAYTFSINHNTVSVPIFQFKKYDSKTKELFNISGNLKLYGSYFRIQHLGFLDTELEETIDFYTQNAFISRLDYRYDFFDKEYIKMPTALKILPGMRSNKKNKPWYTGKNLESWDCGRKSNQTTFIRMYDKNIELSQNLKGLFLYGDIVTEDYKTFHRLEYEMGKKFCAGYQGSTLNELIDKVHIVSGLNPSDFTGTLYKPKNIVDLSNALHRNRYIKIFKSMHDNLKANGIDPDMIFGGKENVTNEELVENIGKTLKLIGLDPKQYLLQIKKDLFKKFETENKKLTESIKNEEIEHKANLDKVENNEFFLSLAYNVNND